MAIFARTAGWRSEFAVTMQPMRAVRVSEAIAASSDQPSNSSTAGSGSATVAALPTPARWS